MSNGADAALETVTEIGSAVVEKLKAAKPTSAAVELKLGFAGEAGKLMALWVNRGEESLTHPRVVRAPEALAERDG
jgi:hypothetical protein